MLTPDEVPVLVDALAAWPPGRSDCWLLDEPDCTPFRAVTLLGWRPQLLPRCHPAIRLAQLRQDPPAFVWQALSELARTCGLTVERFAQQLDADPAALAAALRDSASMPPPRKPRKRKGDVTHAPR